MRVIIHVKGPSDRSAMDTVDARAVLRKVQYTVIADRCPQCFKPFVEFLSSLQKEIPV